MLWGRSVDDPPIAGARVPRTVVMEQDADGKWWANKPAFGPFDTVRDAELAVFGRSELSAGKRDWRDDARPTDEPTPPVATDALFGVAFSQAMRVFRSFAVKPF